ncbi:DUF7536 family protein [Natrononativus amylolyticus]|uniref:DUF7536 family protein n=1 Tax=Natrononativus amylolyticus TaxID=2963434 RepID=UPI0020CC70ED|nr:hypothetical protein [Natrononativus amylolyticus]
MSQDRPERPPTAQFLAALNVRRNARVGLVAGIWFTLAVYLFFIVVPAWSSQNVADILSAYYLALAFTLATTTAGIVAIALTIRSAVALSRELNGNEDG